MLSFRRFAAPACKNTARVAFFPASIIASPVLAQSSMLCSAPAATSTTSSSSSSPSSSSSSNRGGGNNRRSFGMNNKRTALPVYATVEFFDVRDTPADGRELRATFFHEAPRNNQVGGPKGVTLNMTPQLGPRKTDPHDPTPQFDSQRRTSARLHPVDLAEALYWLSGRSSEPSVNVTRRLTLKNSDNGVVTVTITGQRLDGTVMEPMSYDLQPHQRVQFKAFLEESLFGYWDLPAF